ncbi:MAG: hypothetical protein Q8R36_02605 [bacterium]|nr:hypothetical protein [bacterium]
MNRRLSTFLALAGAALLFGFTLYGLLYVTGVLDHRNISQSKILVPQKGTYGCDIVQIDSVHHTKDSFTAIRSISVTCKDPKSKKIKKYTFTQLDGSPKYMKGPDNHEGWWVNSINIFTDPSLNAGEGHVIIFTTKKSLKTHISIFLPETLLYLPENNM